MSISQDGGATVICREVFDESSQPSNEEVREYARHLGIDPDAEPHLLNLAREGLMAALPKGWVPCFHEASGAWYYYQSSTGTTTWEHPLDAVYKELVQQARAGNTRQTSVEEDSKTTAKDLKSHEEASLPKETSSARETPRSTTKTNPPLTRIPSKLTPLKKSDRPEGARRKEYPSQEKLQSKRDNDPKLDNPLATDRAARDYTNLKFQDPKFYECPKVLDTAAPTGATMVSTITATKKELDLKEVLKRSESLSPRHEKDWEQLSSKFNVEENIIDIDKLSITALARSEKSDKFEKEKHPSQIGQPKELTLSGGGTMFLKSNRSRDATPCQEGAKLEDFKAVTISDEASNVVVDKLKSILREKQSEVDDRPTDEERKSVRFDTEKEVCIKFTYSESDDEWESEPEEQNAEESSVVSNNAAASTLSSQSCEEENKEDTESKVDEDAEKSSSLEKAELLKKNAKIIGRRFVVQNVSENEHRSQMARESSPRESVSRESVSRESVSRESVSRESSLESVPTNKFDKIKNIDLVSRSETDCSVAKSSDSDEFRKNKLKLDKPKEAIGRSRNRQTDDEDTSDLSRINQELEIKSFEKRRARSNQEHRKDIQLQKKGSQDKLELDKLKKVRGFTRDRQTDDEDTSDLSRVNQELEIKSSENRRAKLSQEQPKDIELLKKESQNKLELDKPKKVRSSLRDRQTDDEDTSDLSKVNQELELKSFEEPKAKLSQEHPKDIRLLKKDVQYKLEQTKRELEEIFRQQKKLLQKNLNDKLEKLRREMACKEQQEIQKLILQMDAAHVENLKEVRAEVEACHEKERQEILMNLKAELDAKKRELLELRNQEMGKLESEHQRILDEEKLAKLSEVELSKQHSEKIETMKKELDKEFKEVCANLRTQQREKIAKITEDHEKYVADILRDFRMDEDLTRKSYQQRLEEIRANLSRDIEKETKKQLANQQESMDVEKMRTEYRLLQERYTTLKERYRKLKNDVLMCMERRKKKAHATASETEKSTSTRTRTERTESSEQNTPVKNSRSNSAATAVKPTNAQAPSEPQAEDCQQPEDSNAQKAASGFQKAAAAEISKKAARVESDDTTTASETNANIMKKRKNFSKRTTNTSARASSTAGNNNNNNPENPVENIRKQLEKLEDLGDQLPSNDTAYTLRYPFQDKAPVNASSELEFFRHRIHVERDSVRRAQEALRQQENVFQSRQRAWKQRSARATLEQLVQEERELSDMEVSLHRTRSLLGEKVIHLRHLEQTLERVASVKRNEDATSTRNDELTLSDMSSASSGFSSTDLGTDTFMDKPDHYQESTEIIASLENLNSEIREIWGVLNKRQDSNVPHSPTLMYSYLRWLRSHHLAGQPNKVQGTFGTPNIQSNILSQLTAAQPPTTTTQNIIAQYGRNSGFTTSVGNVEKNTSNLMERTWNLRDWLRQARVESTDFIGPSQATL